MPEIIEGDEMPQMANYQLIEEIERSCKVTFAFDFNWEEMIVLSEHDKPIVFDFSSFTIGNIDKESFEEAYSGCTSILPEKYQKRLNRLKILLGTEVMILGEGWMRCLAIKVYNQYVIIGQIVIDMEDDGGPDDDGGEPIPEDFEAPDGASLFFYCILPHMIIIICYLLIIIIK